MEERAISSEPYRLRSVSAYPDPLLVMKLPMEGTVQNGQVRLDNGTVLGFVHSPLTDQTRVEVYYDGWLFARKIGTPGQAEGKPVGEAPQVTEAPAEAPDSAPVDAREETSPEGS